MVTVAQKQRILKAKVAVAMYDEFHKVPKEEEIEYMYRLSRILYKAVVGTHFLRRRQEQNGQLSLF
jgi:hypothetical protein